MRQLIVATLIFLGSILNANPCFLLSEDTIGAINSDLLDSINKDSQKTQEAIDKKQAFIIQSGSKICNTGKSNFTAYTRQISFEQKILWIDDQVRAEKIQ